MNSIKHIFNSNVSEDCELQQNVRQQIKELLPYYKKQRITITIEKFKSKRSDQQNRYLHALFTIFKNELNALGNEFSMQQVKDLCKLKFAKVEMINTQTGEVMGERIKGTSEMNKTELNEFIENIIMWAASYFSISLPYPNETTTLNFD